MVWRCWWSAHWSWRMFWWWRWSEIFPSTTDPPRASSWSVLGLLRYNTVYVCDPLMLLCPLAGPRRWPGRSDHWGRSWGVCDWVSGNAGQSDHPRPGLGSGPQGVQTGALPERQTQTRCVWMNTKMFMIRVFWLHVTKMFLKYLWTDRNAPAGWPCHSFSSIFLFKNQRKPSRLSHDLS